MSNQNDHDAPPVVRCADLTFTRAGWWHEDENRCNHYASSPDCTNGGGSWLPVYVKRQAAHIDDLSPRA